MFTSSTKRWIDILRARLCVATVPICLVALNCSCSERKETALPEGPPANRRVAARNLLSPGPATEQERLKTLVDEEKARRKKLDETLWAKEIDAQRHEQFFVDLWDSLRASDHKYAVLSSVSFEQLTLPDLGPVTLLDHGIEKRTQGEASEHLDLDAWKRLLLSLEQQNLQLIQSEWHHETFESDGATTRSIFAVKLHVSDVDDIVAHQLQCKLLVDWSTDTDASGNYSPRKVQVSDLTVLSRAGRQAFQEVIALNPDHIPTQIASDDPSELRDLAPLLVYDLDGDGRSEIILVGRNVYLSANSPSSVKLSPLCQHAPPTPTSAILGDFTGDGFVDYVCSGNSIKYPLLFEGNKNGKFLTKPRQINTGGHALNFALAMTAGDIDADGDLDLWVTQYIGAYMMGNMPTPYYDANDGPPACLLINDGKGNFREETVQRGLAAKRQRRTYATSFVDLDGDRDLDLLVTCDFAGADIYLNDGKGYFKDVTSEIIDEPANFGMAHTFGDFDLDGRIDFLVSGMGSSTARRLEQMNLGRAEFPEYNAMRMLMGYGNRMYLNRGERYEEPVFRDEVARTGWSWGCSALDFDNDGDSDIYVANGHQSGKTSKDYCTQFWRHDLYREKPGSDPVMSLFYRENLGIALNNPDGGSWNGYEKNRLLMNLDGEGFTDVAFLMGVAVEYDARHVVANDLNGDGLVDLIVMEESIDWNAPPSYVRQTLHVYYNQASTPNNWIGVKLREEKGRSPLGATIVLSDGNRQHAATLVSGDSFQSQHALVKHFGLGSASKVEWLEVQWVDGRKVRIESPAINTYHAITSGK